MSDSPIYANAVISCRENRLLTAERVRKMLDAASDADAFRVLAECGYDDALLSGAALDADAVIADEMVKAVALFSELCPDPVLKNIITARFDYHNAKVFLKAKYSEFNADDALFPLGNADKLREDIKAGKTDGMPPAMAAAFSEIAVNSQESAPAPRFIDTVLDKAYYEETAALAKRLDKELGKYFIAEADLLNIGTYIRCRLLKLSLMQAEAQFIAGGSLDKERLAVIIKGADHEVIGSFADTDYYGLLGKDPGILSSSSGAGDFENAAEDYLFAVAEAGKEDMYTVRPRFYWYIRKISELKAVKLIFICRRNNIPHETVYKKLRRVYV